MEFGLDTFGDVTRDAAGKLLPQDEVWVAEEASAAEEVAAVIRRVLGDGPSYLTFDIDCLDPAYAPGTGTPVAGGPSSAKILSVLRKLGPLDIRGSDVVEVAPAYDNADITSLAAATLAKASRWSSSRWSKQAESSASRVSRPHTRPSTCSAQPMQSCTSKWASRPSISPS